MCRVVQVETAHPPILYHHAHCRSSLSFLQKQAQPQLLWILTHISNTFNTQSDYLVKSRTLGSRYNTKLKQVEHCKIHSMVNVVENVSLKGNLVRLMSV